MEVARTSDAVDDVRPRSAEPHVRHAGFATSLGAVTGRMIDTVGAGAPFAHAPAGR